MAAERTPVGTEFFSAHIERVREAMATVDENDEQAKVEAEIEASKVHWSELSSAYFTSVEGPATESSSSSSQSKRASEVEGTFESSLKVVVENVELFRSLEQQYPGGFFFEEDYVIPPDLADKVPWQMIDNVDHSLLRDMDLELSEKPFAEGAQAELFYAHFIPRGGHKMVMKVFKEGTSLKDLLSLFPSTMLADDDILSKGVFGVEAKCNRILGARLLKSSGRFAFLMMTAWGDLRKLIDVRMVHFNNESLPFPSNVAIYIMHEIAQGMQGLHERDIIQTLRRTSN